MQTIHIQETVAAPIERVFELFADHQRFTALFGGSCERIVDGAPEPNGLGSVRRIGRGPLSFDETIVAFEPHARIDYEITRGGPLENHLGQICLREVDGATEVDYRIRFEGKLPLVAPLVKKVLEFAWRRHAPAQLASITTASS